MLRRPAHDVPLIMCRCLLCGKFIAASASDELLLMAEINHHCDAAADDVLDSRFDDEWLH